MERIGFHARAAAFLIDLLLFAVVAHVAIAIEVTVFVIAGCFRALKADRQAFHDLAAGTAVFATRELVRALGFVPLIAPAASAVAAELPVPALSIESQAHDAGAPLTR